MLSRFWILGFVVQVFLFASIFEVYFQSPIVQVDKCHRGTVDSGFKRVVFFVADGLRVDTFFDHPYLRPHLLQIIYSKNAVYGISDTRVPTESRPGHIALFAGFYEDPSAVFTGWKENIVEFDSVFNRTKASIALGSPDVVLMFSKGAAASKVYSETYSPDWQDFLAANSSILDTWVYDKFEALISTNKVPRHDQVLIFLHLLGIDNTGHATKPSSSEYLNGMVVVDDIVKKVERLTSTYFGDQDTLFVFTSDHGMTNWGSHGGGSPHETETPFVIWGKGIKGGQLRLNQADFSSLVSGCLRTEFTTNSIGRFPSAIWENKRFAYDALRTNVLQAYELLLRKRELVANERNFNLEPFLGDSLFIDRLRIADDLAARSDLESALQAAHLLLDSTLEGCNYYERYDETLLVWLTVVIFALWITVTGFVAIDLEPDTIANIEFIRLTRVFTSTILALFVTKGLIGWSIRKFPYAFFPIYLSQLIFTFIRRVRIKVGSLLLWMFLFSIGVWILGTSFRKRAVLTLGYYVSGVWSVGSYDGIWQLGGMGFPFAVLGVFPLFPVMGKENRIFMTLGPVISAATIFWMLALSKRIVPLDKTILQCQAYLIVLVATMVHYPTHWLTRVTAWGSIPIAILVPLWITPNHFILRLLSIFAGISVPFSFLSVGYESIFLPILCLVLLQLMKNEMEVKSWEDFLDLTMENMNRWTKWENMSVSTASRRAWLHLFFVFFSFFGTGNIASVSSFDPSAVRCFVSVFSPFTMMSLLLLKIVGPFLLVSCFFRRLLWTRVQVQRNFLMVLFLCQGLALVSFFRVTNKGSWLQIGMSISEYTIVQVTTLFLFILYVIANFLVTIYMHKAALLPITTTPRFKFSRQPKDKSGL